MRRKESMTLDECARRMERLLNKPPRKAKTRAYVATLPKRRQVTVTVSEYRRLPKVRLARYRRKDRLRPSAAKRFGQYRFGAYATV